jgi:hypothetical protein
MTEKRTSFAVACQLQSDWGELPMRVGTLSSPDTTGIVYVASLAKIGY